MVYWYWFVFVILFNHIYLLKCDNNQVETVQEGSKRDGEGEENKEGVLNSIKIINNNNHHHCSSSNICNNNINNNNNNNNNNKLKKIEIKIEKLKEIIKEQKQWLNKINGSMLQYNRKNLKAGIIYSSMEEYILEPLAYRQLLIQPLSSLSSSSSSSLSLSSSSSPLIMVKVTSIKLVGRNSAPVRNPHGRFQYNSQTKYIHVIITLTLDGTLQLWDERQKLLFTLSANEHYWPTMEETHQHHQHHQHHETSKSKYEIKVMSDVYHEPSRGGTWLVLTRNDTTFINYYDITAWKKEDDRPKRSKNYEFELEGSISLLKTVHIPPICSKYPDEENTKITENTDKHAMDLISALTFYYEHKQRFVTVGTKKGCLYNYRLTGGDTLQKDFSYSYVNPHNNSASIISVHPSVRKLDVVYVTAYGWQLSRIPRFRESSGFCSFDNNQILDISSTAVDKNLPNILYIGTSNGELWVYDMKQRINPTHRCWYIDRFFIGTERSPLTLQTMFGYLFVGTNTGLFVYNQTEIKSYQGLILSYVRTFENDVKIASHQSKFEQSVEIDSSIQHFRNKSLLLSVHEDTAFRTIIAYGHHGTSDSQPTKHSILVTLESLLPVTTKDEGQNTVFQFITKSPLVIGGAVVLFMFFKGKRQGGGGGEGGGGSFAIFGKLFGGGTRNRTKGNNYRTSSGARRGRRVPKFNDYLGRRDLPSDSD